MKKVLFLAIIFFFVAAGECFAAKRYWKGTSNSWKAKSNWSATSGGAGGATVPGSSDTAYFNSAGNAACTLDSLVNVKRLEIASTYSATITHSTNTVTIGTSGAVLSGGTFAGGSASITATGAVTISGCAFTSTSGTFTSSKNFTYSSGSFTHNSGIMKFTATNTISGSVTMYKLEFAPTATATFTIASGTTLTVTNTLTMSGSSNCTIDNGDIKARGNIVITNSGTAVGGSATLTIDGSGNQTLDGSSAGNAGRLPNVVINKSGGTLYLQDYVVVSGNYTRTAGDTDPGTSYVNMSGTKTISGTDTLYQLNFGTGTHTISNTLNVLNTLTIGSATNTVTINTGNINAQGDVMSTNTSTSTGGTATININSSGNQTITGSGTAGAGKFPNITIDKTGGSITLASIISVTGNWNYIKGDVDPSTSTVALYGNFNLDGQVSGAATCMRFYNLTVGGNTRTLTGNLDVNNNLTISTGTTLSAAAYTLNVGGNWNSQGTWTYSTSTVVFDGSSYNTIKGASGATVNFANVTVNRGAGSVTLQNPMKVNTAMTLTKGRIKTTSSYYLEFADNATCTVPNDDSAYVHGPVRKTGNDAFTFPLGDTTLHDSIAYHPLGISAPSSASDRFEAQYYAIGQTAGDSLVDSLTNLNDVEYWRLDRQVGSSNVLTTLYWNANSDNVEDYNILRVANWNNAKWLDLGGANITVSKQTGSVSAVTSPTYVSNSALLTISKRVTAQSYAVLHRKLDGGYYLVKNGALYFMYDEEYNDTDNELTFTIYDEQRRTVASSIGTYAIAVTSDYGDNRFYINLFDCSTNANGSLGAGNFILEVTNEKSEKWLLRFKHVTTITPNCSGGGGGGQ